MADSAYNQYQGTTNQGQLFWGYSSTGVTPGSGGAPNATGSSALAYSVSQSAEVTDSAGNGATTSADGQGGNSPTGYAGGPAGSGTTLGGVGVTNGSWGSGGGGGGGYYGGGGGQLLQVNQNDGDQWEVTNYAGGGGSSYVTPAATNVSYPASATPANGSVTITYNSPVPAVSPVNNETFTYDAQDHVTSETTTAGATTTVVTYSLDALERVVQREVTVNGTVTEDDQYGYANGGAAAISVTNLLGSGARAPRPPRRPRPPPARRRRPRRPPPRQPTPPRPRRHPRLRPRRRVGAPSAQWAAWPTPAARPPRCQCRPKG